MTPQQLNQQQQLLRGYLDMVQFRKPQWLDDDTIICISNENGVDQLWRINLSSHNLSPHHPVQHHPQPPTQLTHNENFISDYIIDRNNQRIFFTMSEGGNEQFHIYMLDETNRTTKISPAGDMVNYLGALRRTTSTTTSRTTPTTQLIYTSNQRDFANFDLTAYDTTTHQHTTLLENNDNYNFPTTLSPNNRYFIYQKLFSEEDQPLWLYDFDRQTAEPLFATQATYDKPVWKNDSTGFYFLTNLNHDFMYIAEYDLTTKTFQPTYTFNWDVENISLSPDGQHLAALINADGLSQLKLFDTTDMTELPIANQPQGVMAYYDTLDWSPDSQRLLFTFSSGAQPLSVLYLDLPTQTFKTILKNTLINTAVEPVLKHYTSFDGLTIPYWLYIPQGMPAKNLPMVIEIHGGPEFQERAIFNEYIQYMLANGMAVAAPNVRGSTGYGKAYEQLDNVEKRLDSVKDIEYLVKELIAKQTADPEKILVSGTSYGGFMSLSSAARFPDLFCGAVDNVGMFNLVSFLENTSSYRRAHRESEYGTLAHDREVLYQVSPISAVDNIKGPLMVIHGANDARVPVDEAEQLVGYLLKKAVDVTYLRYEDEGHVLQKRANKLDCYPQVIDFIKACMNLSF
ncbi:S9 family peptidase [Fundicoccus culcitae]|uniref:S9 family peptidase n=1 Tax=Fundicoccus culcitae TaxID=2969821 RepID=A0ABY5P4D5_9LACT|nr:S9 family peptidase [Fundicoccus culcitae]UUX33303.1 S9 family peptidase [Fundicoccus culcitae]